MDQYEVLQQYFGHDAFRDGQEPLVDALLGGRDVFGIMPTGGGKSLCYQVPALMLPGVTLVISPLISLMKDQVMALRDAGVAAAFLNSALSYEEMQRVCRRMETGTYKIVYVAPERLTTEEFVTRAQRMDISLVAVDEAHCISQWGQDFRPSYLKIADFLQTLPRRPLLGAFTATATARVQEDIVRVLGLRNPLRIVTGFDRPNLYFEVQKLQDRMAALIRLIEARRDKSGIVYCATRANVERVCEQLNRRGIAATRYHAGLSAEERQQNQDDFQYDRKTVMVATNAFGMGIDKSNVGFVLHYNMPKSLEAYYQEAGRAGRDGEPADCILLYSGSDIMTAKFLIQNSGENTELREDERAQVLHQDLQRLDCMVGYCKTTACLRGYILDYFGQPHAGTCANCGNCRAAYELLDIRIPAQMILSCIKRVRDALGYSVGATLIVHVLRGSKAKRVLELGLDRLSTYGLMQRVPTVRVREYLDFLELEGYVRTESVHATLELTPKAADVLFGNVTVEMPVRCTPEAPKQRRKKAVALPADTSAELLDVLKSVRTRLAQEENVPAYIVFSNATLADMVAKRPHTVEEFLEVNGVGARKSERYADAFLTAIRSYDGAD